MLCRHFSRLRLTGKLLVNEGQIELAYLQIRTAGEIRTEATLQGMTQVEAYDGKEDGESRRSRDAKIRKECQPTISNR